MFDLFIFPLIVILLSDSPKSTISLYIYKYVKEKTGNISDCLKIYWKDEYKFFEDYFVNWIICQR